VKVLRFSHHQQGNNMQELTNESHGDENFIDITPAQEKAARLQHLTALTTEGFDLEAIKESLSGSDTFWKHVFMLGAADADGSMNSEILLEGALGVAGMVDFHSALEIQELAGSIDA